MDKYIMHTVVRRSTHADVRVLTIVAWRFTRYTLSKVLGEGLGYMYAANHGISVVCVRIGELLIRNRSASCATPTR
jgi:nucleoside-diphosphate-sugar epimerase